MTRTRAPFLLYPPLLAALAAVAPTEACGLKSGFGDTKINITMRI